MSEFLMQSAIRHQMSDTFMSPQALLEHWQGHRKLTRRVIDAFPEEDLFRHSVGGMRSFGTLAMEMATMGAPMLHGIVTGKYDSNVSRNASSKAEVLERWDEATAEIDALWQQIPASKFAETITAFGTFTGPAWSLIMYVIDNEIHHRGQGYVYLRSLGISPPPFYER
jgi:uncharacterized damage-inducible protein DinB